MIWAAYSRPCYLINHRSKSIGHGGQNPWDIVVKNAGHTQKILKQFELSEKDIDLEVQRINKSLNKI